MKECILDFQDNEMRCWYYDKKDLKVTPSIQDGISYEAECRYRKEGARFIMQCGTAMSLGHNTMATGVVYFHRFYMLHSFQSFPRYVTACCCLFLAGKVEETPKKARDIIKTARALLSDDKFFSFGEDPKEEVMTLERILLQTIKFDLQVEHPYGFLLKYAKSLKGEQAKLQKMVQMAWNFVNDSLSTTVCLQWEPEIIAVAMIHLASKLSKFMVVDWVGRQPHHLRWWDMFVADVTMEILEDICHQVLDLYQQTNSTTSSPPQQPPSRLGSPVPVPNTSSAINNNKKPSTPPSTVQAKSAPIPVLVKSTNDDIMELPTVKSTQPTSTLIPTNLPPPPPATEPIQPHYPVYPSQYNQMYSGHYANTVNNQISTSVPPPPAPPFFQQPPPAIPQQQQQQQQQSHHHHSAPYMMHHSQSSYGRSHYP